MLPNAGTGAESEHGVCAQGPSCGCWRGTQGSTYTDRAMAEVTTAASHAQRGRPTPVWSAGKPFGIRPDVLPVSLQAILGSHGARQEYSGTGNRFGRGSKGAILTTAVVVQSASRNRKSSVEVKQSLTAGGVVIQDTADHEGLSFQQGSDTDSDSDVPIDETLDHVESTEN